MYEARSIPPHSTTSTAGMELSVLSKDTCMGLKPLTLCLVDSLLYQLKPQLLQTFVPFYHKFHVHLPNSMKMFQNFHLQDQSVNVCDRFSFSLVCT